VQQVEDRFVSVTAQNDQVGRVLAADADKGKTGQNYFYLPGLP
jgi:hypothetical protein